MLSSSFYNIKIVILDLLYLLTLLPDGRMLLIFHQMPEMIWNLFQDNYFMFTYICNILKKRFKQ